MEDGSGLMDPLRLLPFLLAPFEGPGGFHIVEWRGEKPDARWVPVGEPQTLSRLLASNLAFEADLTLGAVPYAERGSRLMHASGAALFVRTETGDSARRLAKFKQRPTLVLREGRTNKHVAFWALASGLYAEDIERANRRLSYALNTKAMHTTPDFRFHPPGAVIREGRSRPLMVSVAEQTDELYPVSMTRKLKDRPKPDPSKWKVAHATA